MRSPLDRHTARPHIPHALVPCIPDIANNANANGETTMPSTLHRALLPLPLAVALGAALLTGCQSAPVPHHRVRAADAPPRKAAEPASPTAGPGLVYDGMLPASARPARGAGR